MQAFLQLIASNPDRALSILEKVIDLLKEHPAFLEAILNHFAPKPSV